jgi:hypothetical protein
MQAAFSHGPNGCNVPYGMHSGRIATCEARHAACGRTPRTLACLLPEVDAGGGAVECKGAEQRVCAAVLSDFVHRRLFREFAELAAQASAPLLGTQADYPRRTQRCGQGNQCALPHVPQR